MNRKEELQWDLIKKAKKLFMLWAENNNINIYDIHFVPMSDFRLEVYIFYEKNDDINKNQLSGQTEQVKVAFLEELSKLDYKKHFSKEVSFIFDSNENVVENYEGSYFFRLR